MTYRMAGALALYLLFPITETPVILRYVGKQWRLANHRLCLFLERCCMGVVSQIKDLDNSSSAVPYKWYCKQKSAPGNGSGRLSDD